MSTCEFDNKNRTCESPDLSNATFPKFVMKHLVDCADEHLKNGKMNLFDINVKAIVRVLLTDRSHEIMESLESELKEHSHRFYRRLVESIARQFPAEMTAAATLPSVYTSITGNADDMLYYSLPLRLTFSHASLMKYSLDKKGR